VARQLLVNACDPHTHVKGLAVSRVLLLWLASVACCTVVCRLYHTVLAILWDLHACGSGELTGMVRLSGVARCCARRGMPQLHTRHAGHGSADEWHGARRSVRCDPTRALSQLQGCGGRPPVGLRATADGRRRRCCTATRLLATRRPPCYTQGRSTYVRYVEKKESLVEASTNHVGSTK